jgi:molecular chaperone GrpE (heat shock protein)
LERALVASQQDAHRHLSSSQSVAPPISEIDQNLLQTAQVQLQQLQHQLLRANELLSNERNRTSALQSELSQAVDKATQVSLHFSN